jgi:solute:Na+ symporter, SSS family
VGRLCTVVLYVVAAVLSQALESAQEAFEILISIGAGTGLLYLLRWFWWRINAWTEVVAMISSFAVSVIFFALRKSGSGLPFAQTVIISVSVTTICWLIAAFVTAPTSRERLISFYRKVHPSGPGWRVIREAAGVSEAEAALHSDHMGKAALGWISGCLTIWSSLFAIGNFLYGRWSLALILTAVFVVSGSTLLYVVNTLWDRAEVQPARVPSGT